MGIRSVMTHTCAHASNNASTLNSGGSCASQMHHQLCSTLLSSFWIPRTVPNTSAGGCIAREAQSWNRSAIADRVIVMLCWHGPAKARGRRCLLKIDTTIRDSVTQQALHIRCACLSTFQNSVREKEAAWSGILLDRSGRNPPVDERQVEPRLNMLTFLLFSCSSACMAHHPVSGTKQNPT